MMAGPQYPLPSLKLGGDGDEVLAVEEVERAFGVKLNYSACGEWMTVGDVFAALEDARRNSPSERNLVWMLFTYAISRETLVDPQRIGPNTLLISPSRPGLLSMLMKSVGALSKGRND